MLLRPRVPSAQFGPANFFEELEDRWLGDAIEVGLCRGAPPGRHVDAQFDPEMIEEDATGSACRNRVQRPSDRPAQPGGAHFFSERAERIKARFDRLSLGPSPVEPVLELGPLRGRSSNAREPVNARRRRGGPHIARDAAAAKGPCCGLDHDEAAKIEREPAIAGNMERQDLGLHHRKLVCQTLADRRLGIGGIRIVGAIGHVISIARSFGISLRGDHIELLVNARLAVLPDHDIGQRRRLLLVGEYRRAIRYSCKLAFERADASLVFLGVFVVVGSSRGLKPR